VPQDSGERGDYFFGVKDNQATLKEELEAIWSLEPDAPPEVTVVSKHGGRVEVRRLWASDLLVGYSDWPFLGQGCRLERTVSHKGRVCQEIAYAVTSLSKAKADAKRLLSLWRGHWGIENRLHWVRDVTFDEDRCQVRSRAAPQVMAALRNMTISLLRLAGKPNIAAALRRHAAHPSEALALVGACCG
jgi:predicted transposase YbfD/YdcC